MRPRPFATFLVLVLALAAAWLVSGAPARAQSARARNQDGLKAYEAKRYDEAAEDFQKAAELAPDNLALNYNAGAALAAESKLDDALAPLAKAAEARDSALASRAAFSRGAVAYELARQQAAKGDAQKALPAAAEAAKDALQALRANPADGDARYNYELATRLQKELRQQQQQQQKKDDQKQNDKNKQDDKNKDQKQDQDQKDQQKDQQKKDDQQKQDDQKKKEDQQKQNDQQQQQQQQSEQDQKKQQDQQQKKDQKADQEKKDQQKQAADQQKPEEQQKADNAAPQDDQKDASLNVLNLLDNNDTQALKQMLRRKASRAPQPGKDW